MYRPDQRSPYIPPPQFETPRHFGLRNAEIPPRDGIRYSPHVPPMSVYPPNVHPSEISYPPISMPPPAMPHLPPKFYSVDYPTRYHHPPAEHRPRFPSDIYPNEIDDPYGLDQPPRESFTSIIPPFPPPCLTRMPLSESANSGLCNEWLGPQNEYQHSGSYREHLESGYESARYPESCYKPELDPYYRDSYEYRERYPSERTESGPQPERHYDPEPRDIGFEKERRRDYFDDRSYKGDLKEPGSPSTAMSQYLDMRRACRKEDRREVRRSRSRSRSRRSLSVRKDRHLKEKGKDRESSRSVRSKSTRETLRSEKRPKEKVHKRRSRKSPTSADKSGKRESVRVPQAPDAKVSSKRKRSISPPCEKKKSHESSKHSKSTSTNTSKRKEERSHSTSIDSERSSSKKEIPQAPKLSESLSTISSAPLRESSFCSEPVSSISSQSKGPESLEASILSELTSSKVRKKDKSHGLKSSTPITSAARDKIREPRVSKHSTKLPSSSSLSRKRTSRNSSRSVSCISSRSKRERSSVSKYSERRSPKPPLPKRRTSHHRSLNRDLPSSSTKRYGENLLDDLLLPCDSFDEKWRKIKEVEKNNSEREVVLEKYRKNFCANSEDIHEKLEELNKKRSEDLMELEMKVWTRTSPSELYYKRDETNSKITHATPKLLALCERFKDELVNRAEKVRASRPKFELPPRKNRAKLARHKSEACCHSTSNSSDDSSTDEEDITMQELERKKLHPNRLHEEMWFNDSGEMNDGPLCRCSAKAKRYGIRHGIYAGENHLLKCDIDGNNGNKLYHYRITISPPTNFLTKTPTMINHDEHEFIFEGFSMFSHFPLVKLPTCKVIRFNIEYTILYIEEKLPDNFTIRELDLFHDYLFREILELIDLDFKAHDDSSGCSQFHFMPRFVRELPDNGKEILSMNEVLVYLLDNSHELIKPNDLEDRLDMMQFQWQNFADEVKGMVVTYPGMKPCSVRVDQLDRNQEKRASGVVEWPEIVHFGIRPPQLSYAGNPEYQKAWREYVKFRHLVANMSKPSFEDKRKLEAKENRLKEMRTQSKMKRDVTVAVSSQGFHRTGIMCDVVQHAMLIPVLVCHLRFHRSCDVLESTIGYQFENRYLLQLALTHPSYRENFGTNPDHARNSLTNCGIRQPEYGDRRIHYMNTRKRGINTLINIMSRFGKRTETESNITHNERLEFLGDAVVEFLTSIHLFHIFPDLEEGGLATYRAAIVQNQHLAVLAKRLHLEQYMLYAHGSDLCHDLELRHAMANCFEALMGALFLDATIDVADKVFGETLHKEDPDLLDIWVDYPPHPLQEQEPLGDRKWIPKFELLQKLTKFEDVIGVEFKHIRLLARAFTDRSIGYTNLTLGSNQRLEFLGDTVLQLIASEYLYKFFPEHHEGHLSLLRSSLVNNRTQAVVCDDLGMTAYALYANPKVELKTKDRADLLEAFLGALYVDKDLDYCHVFCHVCFFPRLQDFIMNQDWNDPKSKLQQCCLTLRTMDGGEPDIPIYKVIECKGPTNTRVYTVAVYFQGKRLAASSGHSIQQAEMNAAKTALELSQGKNLFPQLDHQKRVIAKSMKKQKWPKRCILRGRTSKPLHEEEEEFSEGPAPESVKSSRNHSREKSKSREQSRSRGFSKERPRKLVIVSPRKLSKDRLRKHSKESPRKRSKESPRKCSKESQRKGSNDSPRKSSKEISSKRSTESSSKRSTESSRKHSKRSPNKHSKERSRKRSTVPSQETSKESPKEDKKECSENNMLEESSTSAILIPNDSELPNEMPIECVDDEQKETVHVEEIATESLVETKTPSEVNISTVESGSPQH